MAIDYQGYRHAIFLPAMGKLLGKHVRGPERVIPTTNEDNICCCFLNRDLRSLNRRGIGVQALLKQ